MVLNCIASIALIIHKVHKGSSLGYKGFSGTENGFKTETFNRHLEEGGHKRIIENLEKKKGNVQVVGPMDSFTNQLAPELREQVKAKFVACNLVCTEGLPMNTFPAILHRYEAVGVNVGQTHRNERGFNFFCAIMANCIRIAQVTRFSERRSLYFEP